MSQEDHNPTEEAPIEQEIFHLDLHAVIEAQQAAHGVRHDDFAQYHGYCTRRLSRLSHLKDVKKYLVCSSKYATIKPEGGSKARHAYCSRLTDTLQSNHHVPHINVLLYLLVQSERAWAQANQSSKEFQKRQVILKRLKRAIWWAEMLLQKAQVACDPTSIQECQAYASWMKANFALEKLDYATAIQEFAQAMTLCHQLGQQQDNGGALDPAKRLERQDLFMTRADTVLKPLFRYCQYELQQAGQPLLVEEPRLDSSSSSSIPKEGDTTNATIQFRGQDLVLDSKELRVLWLKWQSLASSNDRDETAFLNRLSVLDDALEVVQAQFQTLEQAQAGPAVQAKRQQNRLWKGYLQWLKTQQVMDHTSNLLHTVNGHAERAHIYDALLQHAKSLLQLPRPDQDEDDEFALQAQANILRLRALKTYHMAWHYYQETKNYKAAWTLLQHSTTLCKRAAEEIAACDEDMAHSQEYLEQLDSLPLASLKVALQAAMHWQGMGAMERLATKRPLLLRLNEPDEGTVLAGDLSYLPIPCKPVFYDLAMDYSLDTACSLDRLQLYLDQHSTTSAVPEPTTTTSSGKGLFGWLTG